MSLLTTLTYALPHRALSSAARRLAYSTHPAIKQWLIDTVTRKFGVDLDEHPLHHDVARVGQPHLRRVLVEHPELLVPRIV